MKLRSFLLLAALAAAQAADETVIIDTKFHQKDGQQLHVEKAPLDPSDLPLTSPTRVAVNEPSTVTVGKDAVGDIKPPYALATVGEREGMPEAPANLAINWDLTELALEPGRYKITFQVAVLAIDQDGGNFRVQMLDSNGEVPKAHSGVYPTVSFGHGKLKSGSATMSFAENTPYQVEILVDTKEMTWSSSVDGAALRAEAAFPPDVLPAGSRISGFQYIVAGGMDNCAPGSSLAISDVKMVRQ